MAKEKENTTNSFIDKFAKLANYLGKYVMLAITFFIVLFLFVRIFIGVTPAYFKESKNKVKEQQQKIDSVLASQKFIEDRMFQLETNQIVFQEAITKNNALISETNKQIDKLKKIYNEKIRSVNTYSVRDLDSFFTNRYKQYYK